MALCLLVACMPALAQHATGSDVFSGEQAFQNYCANCHGKTGNQVANVDLGHGVFRKPYDDDELMNVVMKGIPGTPMPATPNMSARTGDADRGLPSQPPQLKDMSAGGDAARGKALFIGKGQCSSCHRVNGEDRGEGRDLSRIRAAAHVRSACHLAARSGR